MQKPRIIELVNNSDIVLRKTLLSVKPNEGCALVIGDQGQSNTYQDPVCWQINLIWPCCNVWIPNEFDKKLNLNCKRQSNYSKKNRFQIDPKEQIAAQKWSRLNQLEVLGSAHSHLTGSAVPSSIDLKLSIEPRLMIIVDQSSEIRAWWVENYEHFEEIEVAFSLTNNNKELPN